MLMAIGAYDSYLHRFILCHCLTDSSSSTLSGSIQNSPQQYFINGLTQSIFGQAQSSIPASNANVESAIRLNRNGGTVIDAHNKQGAACSNEKWLEVRGIVDPIKTKNENKT